MEYKVCKTCVMDTTAEEIVFTKTGCNFCDAARKSLKEVRAESHNLDLRLSEIRRPDYKYDVLIGLSGGVDSSFALVQAVKLGLRPLCFSVDTGYNKPESDENIMRLVEGLKVPFIRYTINLEAFRQLQATFLRAGVKNIEIPTDHVLMAVTYKLAAKYRIKTILSGGNVATESIMPASWGYNARDLVHIKDIHWKFGSEQLGDLPVCGTLKWNWYRWARGIKVFYLLDYMKYNRNSAEDLLASEYGFKSTGEKHEENYFTWWFQNFYLYEKWGIDKRKAHYSSLIVSGQMTRGEAMERLLIQPSYPDLKLQTLSLYYPRTPHEMYAMDRWYPRIARFINRFKKNGRTQ